MNELGTTIRNMRKVKNLTGRKLAELSGVSPAYVSKIENERTNVSPAIIRKLAKGLQCDYALLMNDAVYKVNERDKVIEELVSLNLWSARRLPKVHKEFAYNELDMITNQKHEH